jgi:anaerobic ribonucleoside-triphosphate reductase
MKITRKVINFNKVNQTGGASLSSNQKSLEERVEEIEKNHESRKKVTNMFAEQLNRLVESRANVVEMVLMNTNNIKKIQQKT